MGQIQAQSQIPTTPNLTPKNAVALALGGNWDLKFVLWFWFWGVGVVWLGIGSLVFEKHLSIAEPDVRDFSAPMPQPAEVKPLGSAGRHLGPAPHLQGHLYHAFRTAAHRHEIFADVGTARRHRSRGIASSRAGAVGSVPCRRMGATYLFIT